MTPKHVIGGAITALFVVVAVWAFGGGIIPPVVVGSVCVACATVTGLLTTMSIANEFK